MYSKLHFNYLKNIKYILFNFLRSFERFLHIFWKMLRKCSYKTEKCPLLQWLKNAQLYSYKYGLSQALSIFWFDKLYYSVLITSSELGKKMSSNLKVSSWPMKLWFSPKKLNVFRFLTKMKMHFLSL